MLNRFTSALLALSALFLISTAAQADMLTNGNFETTTNTSSTQFGTNYGTQSVAGWTGSGYTFLFLPGTADTTGATGEYGNLKLWGPGNGSANGLTGSPVGGNYVAMDGAFEQGSISQQLMGVNAGDLLTVSFWYAGAQQYNYNGATTEGFKVSVGSQMQTTPILNDVSHGFTGWQQQSMTFTAATANPTLKFLAVGTPGGEPPFSLLDGVSVTSAATPEPSSLVMLGTGLVGVAGALRRKMRQAI